MVREALELYIHIPFCVKKCLYCDFLSFEASKEEHKVYIDALIQELEQYRRLAESYIVSSIFVGGGTPSIIEGELMACVFEKLREIFVVSEDAEITIEMNPGTMDEKKMSIYKEIGINRVSIGLQATNNDELKMLGRIHTYEEFLTTYEMVRQYGIENVNIDLISGIPNQTTASWEETLKRVIVLNPTHISAYSLIIEEGTALYDNIEAYEELLPSEDEERDMYYLTKEKLEAAGYYRYEISNYAKKGYECRHNLGYWSHVDYLGIGLGSASLSHDMRFTNESNMESYIQKCQEGKSVYVDDEYLTEEIQMNEFMFLGLRKVAGIRKSEFESLFHVSLEEVYERALKKVLDLELIVVEGDVVKLTDFGMDVTNSVVDEFWI